MRVALPAISAPSQAGTYHLGDEDIFLPDQ